MKARFALLGLALALSGCPSAPVSDDATTVDAAHHDAGGDAQMSPTEAGLDAAPTDASGTDATAPDAAVPARSFVYVGLASGDLVTLDGETLDELSRTRTGDFPSFVAPSPDGSHLYVIHEGANELASVSVAADGTTTVLDREPASGGPTHVSIDHGARWVFTASYGSGEVHVFPITASGSIAASVFTATAGANAHMILADHEDAFVYVPCLGIDSVVGYSLDGATGALTRVGASMGDGDGARHIALSPDGTRAYLLSELSGEIDVFAVLGTGLLTHLTTVSSLPPGHTGSNASAEILITRDGRFVYASNRGPDSIAVFRTSGDTLTLIEHEPSGGAHPRSMSLTLDERQLLVANRDSDNVTVFDVAADGSLTPTRTLAIPGRPFFVGAFVAPR
jgi:6-phosphogluconolactonase